MYIENIRIVSLIDDLKMEGIVKWRGLKSQGPLYLYSYSKYNFNIYNTSNIISVGIFYKLRHFIAIKPQRVSNRVTGAYMSHCLVL